MVLTSLAYSAGGKDLKAKRIKPDVLIRVLHSILLHEMSPARHRLESVYKSARNLIGEERPYLHIQILLILLFSTEGKEEGESDEDDDDDDDDEIECVEPTVEMIDLMEYVVDFVITREVVIKEEEQPEIPGPNAQASVMSGTSALYLREIKEEPRDVEDGGIDPYMTWRSFDESSKEDCRGDIQISNIAQDADKGAGDGVHGPIDQGSRDSPHELFPLPLLAPCPRASSYSRVRQMAIAMLTAVADKSDVYGEARRMKEGLTRKQYDPNITEGEAIMQVSSMLFDSMTASNQLMDPGHSFM